MNLFYVITRNEGSSPISRLSILRKITKSEMGKLRIKMARDGKTSSHPLLHTSLLLLHDLLHGWKCQNLCAFLNRRRVFLISDSLILICRQNFSVPIFSNPKLRLEESSCLSSPSFGNEILTARIEIELDVAPVTVNTTESLAHETDPLWLKKSDLIELNETDTLALSLELNETEKLNETDTLEHSTEETVSDRIFPDPGSSEKSPPFPPPPPSTPAYT